jgi:hypothetical protein
MRNSGNQALPIWSPTKDEAKIRRISDTWFATEPRASPKRTSLVGSHTRIKFYFTSWQDLKPKPSVLRVHHLVFVRLSWCCNWNGMSNIVIKNHVFNALKLPPWSLIGLIRLESTSWKIDVLLREIRSYTFYLLYKELKQWGTPYKNVE